MTTGGGMTTELTTDTPTTSGTAMNTTGGPSMEPLDCPLGWEDTTKVSGTTPAGPFAGNFAGFGEEECHGSLFVYIFTEEPQTVDDLFAQPKLRLDLSGEDWAEPFLGTGPAYFHLYAMGPVIEELATGIGQVTITEFEPYTEPYDPNNWPRIVGEFALKADGWDLAGHFEADLCGNLFSECP